MIKEYLAIVGALAETEPIQNDRIIVEREEFKYLLERYAYTTFAQKTKVYKALNFIIHDDNNYTVPYKENNKTVRKVIINYKTYQTVKGFFETELNL